MCGDAAPVYVTASGSSIGSAENKDGNVEAELAVPGWPHPVPCSPLGPPLSAFAGPRRDPHNMLSLYTLNSETEPGAYYPKVVYFYFSFRVALRVVLTSAQASI